VLVNGREKLRDRRGIVLQRFGVWPIVMFCALAAAASSWAQSPFQSAPGPSPPVVRPVRPPQYQQQEQIPPPTVTTVPAPASPTAAPAPVLATPKAPTPPAPPPSLAGRWVGIMTCPGDGDAAMMITVAASAGDQYTMTATWGTGVIGADAPRLSGSITSGKQVSLDQQWLLDHRAITGGVTSPTAMSGIFSSSFTGLKCTWTASKS
jgi:hypothetical protein